MKLILVLLLLSLTTHLHADSARSIVGHCGDGVINGNEQCDGLAVSVASCRALGGNEGIVTCQPNCVFDISNCLAPNLGRPVAPPRIIHDGFCGDGIINGQTEQCDGNTIQNDDCSDYGAVSGIVRCQPNCLLDVSDCLTPRIDREIGGLAETCRIQSLGSCNGGCVSAGMRGFSKCSYRCENVVGKCENIIEAHIEDCSFNCDCATGVDGSPDCICGMTTCNFISTIAPDLTSQN